MALAASGLEGHATWRERPAAVAPRRFRALPTLPRAAYCLRAHRRQPHRWLAPYRQGREMSVHENAEVVRRAYHAFNTADMEALT